MTVNFGMAKQEWEALDNLATELYTADKYNQVVDGSDSCNTIRNTVGYSYNEYAVWEFPKKALQELNIRVTRKDQIGHKVGYDNLDKYKTDEFTDVGKLLWLLNMNTRMTYQDQSVYVLVNKTTKEVIK